MIGSKSICFHICYINVIESLLFFAFEHIYSLCFFGPAMCASLMQTEKLQSDVKTARKTALKVLIKEHFFPYLVRLLKPWNHRKTSKTWKHSYFYHSPKTLARSLSSEIRDFRSLRTTEFMAYDCREAQCKVGHSKRAFFSQVCLRWFFIFGLAKRPYFREFFFGSKQILAAFEWFGLSRSCRSGLLFDMDLLLSEISLTKMRWCDGLVQAFDPF